MAIYLRIKVDGATPILRGSDFFWETLLEMTKDDRSVTFSELDGACSPGQEGTLRDFLKRMTAAGIIERIEGPPHRYRLLQRQRDCPIISNDGKPSRIGLAQQNMWNVMRRSRSGFTAPDLAISASTDEVQVTVTHARKYCQLLHNAGVLVLQTRGKPARSWNIYVLRGSANTGPLPPRRVSATGVYDRNRGVMVGDMIAEEERT